MELPSWSRSHWGRRRRDLVPSNPETTVDPDDWIAMTGDSLGFGVSPDQIPTVAADRATLEHLRARLERVLDGDDDAMMAPPSAGRITDAQWAALPLRQRRVFSRLQIRSLDPRLVTRSWLTRAGPRSLGSR